MSSFLERFASLRVRRLSCTSIAAARRRSRPPSAASGTPSRDLCCTDRTMHDTCQAVGAALALRRPSLRRSSVRPAGAASDARSSWTDCARTASLPHDRASRRRNPMFDFRQDHAAIRSPTPKSGGALAATLPGQRSARDARRGRSPSSAASPSATRAARRRVLEAVFARRRTCAAAARSADRAVHRAREPQLEDRAPALVGAVRPHAGVPARVPGVLARHRRARAQQQVAGAAARADRAARSSTSASTRKIAALPLRAVDPGEVGRAARAVLARVLAAVRAPAAARSSAAARPTTIEHEFLLVLVLQLMNAGNLTPRHLEWVCGELDEWCPPLRLTLEPSSVDVVLRRPREPRRPAAAARRRRSRAACCSSTRGRCTRC